MLGIQPGDGCPDPPGRPGYQRNPAVKIKMFRSHHLQTPQDSTVRECSRLWTPDRKPAGWLSVVDCRQNAAEP